MGQNVEHVWSTEAPWELCTVDGWNEKNWSPSTHTAPGSHTAFRRLTTPERNGRFSNLKAQARCSRKEYPSLDYKNWGNCWRTFFFTMSSQKLHVWWSEVKKYDNNTQRIISNVCFGNNSCRLHKPNVVHKSDGITYSLVVSVFEAPIISSLHTILCGLIKLPSERTLWDYTHWIEWNRCSARSHSTWDCKEIDMPEEVKQHTAVVCDEVKVKDSIGCDKYSCQVTGFTSLGDINSHLLDFERSLGTDQLEPSVAKYIYTGIHSAWAD